MFEELIVSLILAQLSATAGLYWRLFHVTMRIERRLATIEGHLSNQISGLDQNPPTWLHRKPRG